MEYGNSPFPSSLVELCWGTGSAMLKFRREPSLHLAQKDMTLRCTSLAVMDGGRSPIISTQFPLGAGIISPKYSQILCLDKGHFFNPLRVATAVVFDKV